MESRLAMHRTTAQPIWNATYFCGGSIADKNLGVQANSLFVVKCASAGWNRGSYILLYLYNFHFAQVCFRYVHYLAVC